MNQKARQRIVTKTLLYVITQVKHNGPEAVTGTTYNYKLPFVMPVTELLFGVREDAAATAKQFHHWDRYADNNGSVDNDTLFYNLPDPAISTAVLRLMSDDRFTVRDYLYWARYQEYRHHTSTPSTRGIWGFSFALFPEDSLVSGACNFSTSENNYLNLTFNTSTGKNGNATAGIGVNNNTGMLYVFAKNVNYVYIEGGYLTIMFNA
jgi:hypothetical protein